MGTDTLTFAIGREDGAAPAPTVIVEGDSLALNGGAIESTTGLVADIAHPGAARAGSRITEMLNGRRADTGDTALRSGRFFGTSGEFWLNLQQLYELRHAEERKGVAITCLPSPDDGYRSSARG